MENTRYNSEEIEPFCKWRREEQQDVLEVHLQGFRKDRLKVQINNLGVLSISGESFPGENKRIHFRKETNVSKDCNRDEIRAKFSGGVLYITMPKRIIHPVATQTQPTPAQQKQSIDQDKQTNDKTDAAATKRISGLKYAGALAAAVLAVALGAYVAYKYNPVVFPVEE